LNKIIKQTFDWIGGIIFFISTLPILGIIACLIKLSSSGSVFYTQCRVGKEGELFRIYKFRTMYVDAEERLPEILAQNKVLKETYLKRRKIPNDPRITPIGHFLRKTSLDELPQIFNVLKGEMSLVGPRPALPEELEKYYKKEDAEYYLQVKPGITGLWQVSGRNKTAFHFRVKIESWYVQNWCLWLDITILLQTVKAVIKMEGAG
jgi:undecaprenyl-phosphate galactose phosphotransferase